MANEVECRDSTPNNFPQDYDPAKVDPRVKLRSESIKHKQKGKHTREAMYQSLEIGSVTANEAKTTALDTAGRQDASEKIVKDTSDNINKVLSEITENSGDSAAPEVIVAREGHATLNDRLNEKTYVRTDADLMQVNPIFNDSIAETSRMIDTSKFNLGFITDTHWEPTPVVYGRSDLSMGHLANLMQLDSKLNAIIAGGDNTNSYSKSLDYVKKYVNEFGNNLLNYGKHADRFALIGNHDDGSLRGDKLKRDVKPSDIVTIDDFAKAYHFDDRFDEVRDDHSPWFYKDYSGAKIRVIGIQTQDIDETSVNDFDALKYKRQWTFGIRQMQFDFLTKKALVVPEGYAVMIFGHAQLRPDGDYNDDGVWINNQLLINVLNAFKAGSKFIGSGTTVDFEVNVNVDFTQQGEREIIGYFAGHLHKEYFNPASEIKYGANFNMITCLASLNQVSADTGTQKEDGFTILSVDSTAKKCNLIGFGRATNREFSY